MCFRNLLQEASRLGHLVVTRSSDGLVEEEWHDGFEWEAVVREQRSLEAKQSVLKRRLSQAKKALRSLR